MRCPKCDSPKLVVQDFHIVDITDDGEVHYKDIEYVCGSCGYDYTSGGLDNRGHDHHEVGNKGWELA